MKGKMFGHRLRKSSDSERVPGEPYNDLQYDQGDEKEDNYGYVKSKDFPSRDDRNRYDMASDNPPGYEGKEHVRYKDPGHSQHHIRYPQDEPHMGRSNVSREETHEMEDNFHHDVPDQTKYALESKIKRARMKMDAPDQEEPDRLMGNPVHNVGVEGEEDTSGEEEMGPNDMQSGMPKEARKKMIVAFTRNKMKKREKSR